MQTDFFDPKDKTQDEEKSIQEQQNEDGVYLVNDDGTDYDSSEQTYVSVDLDEDKPKDDDNPGK